MRIFLCICLLLVSLPAAAAQETLAPVPNSEEIHPAARYDFTSGPQYERLVQAALMRPADFNFGNLRVLYGLTRAYDPVAEDTQRRLLALSEVVKNAATSEDEKKTLADYNAVVLAHLANVDVVSMALVFAEDDRRFGDPEFFRWAYRGLLGSILRSGDGTTLRRAYDALTVGEEAALLRNLGVKFLASRSVHEGIVYYNVHEVEDIKTGARHEIFVDVTNPMIYLEWEKERRARPLPVPGR